MTKQLTIEELCEIKDVHRSTVHRWCAAGMPVEKHKRGKRRVFFDLEKVNEWLKGGGENGQGGGLLG